MRGRTAPRARTRQPGCGQLQCRGPSPPPASGRVAPGRRGLLPPPATRPGPLAGNRRVVRGASVPGAELRVTPQPAPPSCRPGGPRGGGWPWRRTPPPSLGSAPAPPHAATQRPPKCGHATPHQVSDDRRTPRTNRRLSSSSRATSCLPSCPTSDAGPGAGSAPARSKKGLRRPGSIHIPADYIAATVSGSKRCKSIKVVLAENLTSVYQVMGRGPLA
jgi:hypothetical protein